LIDPAVSADTSGSDDRGESVLEEESRTDVSGANVQRGFWGAENGDNASLPTQSMIDQAAELRVTPHEPDPRKPSRAGIVQEQRIPTGDIGINQLPLSTQAPENGGRCQSQRIEDEPRRNEDF
jgi:hypothetical protein